MSATDTSPISLYEYFHISPIKVWDLAFVFIFVYSDSQNKVRCLSIILTCMLCVFKSENSPPNVKAVLSYAFHKQVYEITVLRSVIFHFKCKNKRRVVVSRVSRVLIHTNNTSCIF